MRARGSLGERNHVLLLLSTAFLCGCICAPWLRPGLWLWAVCLLAGLVIALLRRLGARTGLALALCCFALGALRTHGALPAAQVEPGSYEISGFVYGGAALKSDGRIAFTLGNITLDGAPRPAGRIAPCTMMKRRPSCLTARRCALPAASICRMENPGRRIWIFRCGCVKTACGLA